MEQVITASRRSLASCNRALLDVPPAAGASFQAASGHHVRDAPDDRGRVLKRARSESDGADSGSSSKEFPPTDVLPASHHRAFSRTLSVRSMESERGDLTRASVRPDGERLRSVSDPAVPDGAREHQQAAVRSSQAESEATMGGAETASVVKGYATTPRGQVHYRRCGSGHPIVLLHDAGRSSSMWAPVMPLLAARGCCAVAVDLPGCGETTVACRDYSMLEIGAITVAAVINIGFTQRFDLVGHGFGASLAMQMATVFPARIRRLGVWGIMPQDERARRLTAAAQAQIRADGAVAQQDGGEAARDGDGGNGGDGAAAASPLSVVAAAVQQILMRNASQHAPLHQIVEVLTEGLESLPARHLLARAHAAVEHGELLDKVQQPVLCLAGCDDPFQFETMMAASRLSKGKYYHINSAGTEVLQTHSQQYVQTLLEFLGSQ